MCCNEINPIQLIFAIQNCVAGTKQSASDAIFEGKIQQSELGCPTLTEHRYFYNSTLSCQSYFNPVRPSPAVFVVSGLNERQVCTKYGIYYSLKRTHPTTVYMNMMRLYGVEWK